MRIEQLIVQHLYKNKLVSLEGIGSIHLDPSVALPNEGDKDFVMPENAFTFSFNLKTSQDNQLIDFIVEQTKKIKPLATSDLESYCMLAKQFLNIGKPLVIEGVGTIQKNQAGNYEFKPGTFITPKIDDYPKQAKEKTEDNVSFESESKVNNSRRNLMILIVAIIVALISLSVYYFLFSKKTPPQEPLPEQSQGYTKDSTAIDTIATIKIDTTKLVPPVLPVAIDSAKFNIVIKEFTNALAANKAYGKYIEYGHKVILISKDSPLYKIAIPFNRPMADTLKAKDSLKKFFGGSPYIIFQ